VSDSLLPSSNYLLVIKSLRNITVLIIRRIYAEFSCYELDVASAYSLVTLGPEVIKSDTNLFSILTV